LYKSACLLKYYLIHDIRNDDFTPEFGWFDGL